MSFSAIGTTPASATQENPTPKTAGFTKSPTKAKTRHTAINHPTPSSISKRNHQRNSASSLLSFQTHGGSATPHEFYRNAGLILQSMPNSATCLRVPTLSDTDSAPSGLCTSPPAIPPNF